MPTTNPTEYDARTGFHDIKALPEFHPINLNLIIICFSLLLIGLLIFLWLRRKPKIKPLPQISAEQQAISKLTDLENKRSTKTIELRNYSSELSLIIRSYLEQCFSFPATDLTTKQVTALFDKILKEKLPSLIDFDNSELALTLTNFLQSCDGLSFGSHSETDFDLDHQHLIQLATIALSLVKKLSQAIETEKRVQEQKQKDLLTKTKTT